MGAWRVVLDGEADGAWNMGVDEALLEGVIGGRAPTLRLYGWRGPWLSLGRAQVLDTERLEACAQAGVGLVRRVSGGAAVLHGCDLTYTVAASETALPAGLEGSYALLGETLRNALRACGIEASVGAAGREGASPRGVSGERPFDCFSRPAAHELCVAGRKLAGSAQRRARGGVLQHGSIRLRPDPDAVCLATGIDGAQATDLAAHDVDPERFRTALLSAFEVALDQPLTPGGLEPPELDAAQRFAQQRLRPDEQSPRALVSPQGASRHLTGGR